MVVGLGNPGDRYSLSRHNIGFQVLDRLAEHSTAGFSRPLFSNYSILDLPGQPEQIYLIKPLTFMNRSGNVFPRVFRKTGLGIDSMLVICDQLDLPVGVCRLKRRGSSGGHRGLRSIIEHTGTEEFLRLYIGIGRPDEHTSVYDYVLGSPSTQEQHAFDSAIVKASEAVLKLQSMEPEKVMNELNRKE